MGGAADGESGDHKTARRTFFRSIRVEAMLDFEIALARAEARLKIIPQSAAEAIASAARAKRSTAQLC